MAFIIPDCLSADLLSQITRKLPLLSWRDGKETAGALAKTQKNNQQADLSTRDGSALKTVLSQAVISDTTLQKIAWPKAISRLMISQTPVGGGYDWHTDDALMATGNGRLRTDLSFTLFLNAPEDYEGGALEIHTDGAIEGHKYPAGHMVVYSSGSLHRVAQVTAGKRIVCIGWVESFIRDSRQRDILFDLLTLRETLSKQYEPATPEILTLSKTISNLLRQWSEG